MKHLSLVLLALLSLAGCTRQVDVTRALAITDVRTGWFDAGINNGQNKLVPSVAFTLRNVDEGVVGGVQINAIFKRVGENDGWGEHYVQAIDRDGIQPGAASKEIVLRSNLGYTGTESRVQMLRHAQFVDARVEIFGKQGRGGWVKIGEYNIERQLLTE